MPIDYSLLMEKAVFAKLAYAAIFFAGCAVALAADAFHQTLINSESNVRIDDWQVTNQDLGIQSEIPWSVSKYTLHGGRQEGVDILTLDNGGLCISLVPTRGMGILEARLGDVRLGWNSPVKEVVHPQYINLHSRGGLGWLEGFNEWMARCGLEFAGHPGTDKFINNVGEEAEMQLTLHGKIANIPASVVEVLIDRQPPHRIRIRGRVDENMFYGPKLELWTEVSTEPGSNEFCIEDQLTNRGAYEQEFQLIYHANYGFPLLEKGSRFLAAARRVTPFNGHAASHVDGYDRYAAPTPGFIEQVYCIHPYADANGTTMAMLSNSAGDRAATMRFSAEQLPYLTLWKNTTAAEEGYVTGLEPGTGFPLNRRIERQFGRVPKLKGGESRQFRIDIEVLSDREQVQEAAKQIEQIRAGRKTQVDREPIM